MRWITALPLVLLLSTPSSGSAQEPLAGTSFEGEASVLWVEVGVRVTRKGEAVEGLRPENFQVFDRGKEREIVGFEVLLQKPRGMIAATSGYEDELPSAQVIPRSYLLVFDFAYGSGESLSRALRAASAFVDRELGEDDHVGVAFFSALRGLRVISDFTHDQGRTLAALATVAEMLARRPEMAVERFSELGEPPRGAGPSAAPLASVDEVRREAGILVKNDPFWAHRSVIRDLARGLAEIPLWAGDRPGIKRILLFSHGFENRHYLGSGGATTLRELESTFRSLRDARWSIEAFNSGGLRAPAGREALFLLAHETGGSSYENFNDLKEATRLMLEKTRITYLLAFRADDVPRDGRFRRLRVRLEPGMPGSRVVHRPGYYAPVPAER